MSTGVTRGSQVGRGAPNNGNLFFGAFTNFIWGGHGCHMGARAPPPYVVTPLAVSLLNVTMTGLSTQVCVKSSDLINLFFDKLESVLKTFLRIALKQRVLKWSRYFYLFIYFYS